MLQRLEMEVKYDSTFLFLIEIYNSVDACTSAKDMWKRVERLMRGTIQNKVDRETRFTNKFDQFVAEPGEALVSVYNRFAQLMNDLERNNMNFPTVTINTKFLNSLQPEWLKYVTQVLNASRAKKLEKSHDPLALVANTGSSSRQTSSYYVTHPTSVVDYDDEYQQDDVHNNSEDPLVSAMLLLAKAITQNFSNPTNNRLRASSNTRNQAIIQGDRVNIQSRNSGNTGRNNRRAYVQEEVVEGMNAPNETGNVQRTLRTPSSGNTSTVQCYNCSGKGHYARNCPKPRVRDSKYFMEQMMEEIKELSVNICLMARIQPANHTSDDEAQVLEKLENENVSLDFKVQSLIKERDNVKLEYQKLFDSIKKTRSQTQKEMDELIVHVSEKTYAYGAIRAENQNLLSTISELKTRLEKVEKGKSVNTKFDKTNGYQSLLCVTPLNKHAFQKKTDVPKTEENHVVSKPVTLQTSPTKQTGANQNTHVIRPGMYRVVTTQESQTNKTKSALSSTGMNATSRVRRPMSRDSHVAHSVLDNSKKAAKNVAVYVRKNKQTDNTSANVIPNKENVIDVDVTNASTAKTLLCVSCMENVIIPCHDKCVAKHKLNMRSNVRRTFSTNSRPPKSSETTFVAPKTRCWE
ncbi:gag-pol polyprotein [Tanacetum coccineum]|uniref:Gag-pol polyprotein n=1 Tax=Tanacetum coccineum TaxID=301880 RepID=A0ABQ5DZ86_9ASTR